MCALNYDNLGDPIGLLKYSEKLFNVIEKSVNRKMNYYEYAIKSILLTMIDELDPDMKNLLFKLMLALSTHPDEL